MFCYGSLSYMKKAHEKSSTALALVECCQSHEITTWLSVQVKWKTLNISSVGKDAENQASYIW